jgi:hypothetical protein
MSVFSCGVQGSGQVLPIELTQFQNDNANTSANITVNYNATGSNRFMIAIVAVRDAAVASTSTVTFNGVAGTRIQSASSDSGVATSGVLVYWTESQLPSVTGNYALDHNFGGSPDESLCASWQFQNVNQTTPLNHSNKNSGTQWLHGASKSITNSGELGDFSICGFAGNDDDAGYAANEMSLPAALTEKYDNVHPSQNRFLHVGGDEEEKATGAVTYTWINQTNQGIDSWVMFCAAINQN